MAVLVTDPDLEQELIEHRQAIGADRFDEVWEGVYMMAPFPGTERQGISLRLGSILLEVVEDAGLGSVLAGANLAGDHEDWKRDYRVPDVVVFLHGGPGEDRDSHWRGGADLVVEVTSANDRTYEKLPFYGRVGVRELLIVDRDPWTLRRHVLRESELQPAGTSTVDGGETLTLTTADLQLRRTAGEPRPRIEVTHAPSGRHWTV